MEINAWAILMSFLINFLKRYSSKVCSFLVDKFYNLAEKNDIDKLNEEIKSHKHEKDSFNPIDEFAKYALADRKLNKALDKLQKAKTSIRTFKMKKMFYFNVAYTLIIGIFSIALIINQYDKPIIDFSNLAKLASQNHSSAGTIDIETSTRSEEAPVIFYPLNNFLSFPSTDKKNSIGVTAMLFLVNRSIEIFINIFQNNRVKVE